MTETPSLARRLDAAINYVLVAAAIGVVGLLGFRQFGPQAAPASGIRAPRPPELVSDLTAIDSAGIRIGSREARIQIVEFSDFQCPYCKRFSAGLRAVMNDHPRDISLTYVHFPLDGHAQARPAALAAQCAASQGRFVEMHDAIFRDQATLPAKPWLEYAKEAGLPDLREFSSCLESPNSAARIEADLQSGKRLGIPGTPTVFINGWRFDQWPDESQLRDHIKVILSGEKFDPARSFKAR
jgi:protein-disulfide isomerase